MKFICLFFAVVFLGIVQSDEADLDQAEKQEAEALEDLSGPQDENPDGYDEALEDEGNMQRKDRTRQCWRSGGRCFLALCPRGTTRIGKCTFSYLCCKAK
ncbi:AAZ75612.1CLP-POGU2 [Podarcis lilfordi]|uniref:AAZ75612.1CLP-POGU2 n=1 Tax=Podarcis lilfordi TaxID=74358 RepID=A0AA35K460_9SAUR|nr:AAZ75612.1CLP-POGU2 [Podarcis lilfordi]